MKKFFCDIMGTFDGASDRKSALSEFSTYLKKLADDDELSFSFVSSENADFVKTYVEELKPYLTNSNVFLDNHYCNDEIITSNGIKKTLRGKSLQIYFDIAKNDYDAIYYAEDSPSIILIVKGTLKRKFPNINLEVFRAIDGIDSLNCILSEHINSKKSR